MFNRLLVIKRVSKLRLNFSRKRIKNFNHEATHLEYEWKVSFYVLYWNEWEAIKSLIILISIKIYSLRYCVYIEFLDFENYYKFETMAEVEKKEQEHHSDSDDGSYDPEETVIGAEWKQCDLPEVPVVTGEEDEEVVIKMRSKIYRWRN